MRAGYTINQESVQLSPQIPVRVQAIHDLGHTIDAHDHEFCELVCIRSGQGKHGTAAGQRALSAGDVLIMKPGQVHCLQEMQSLSLYNVYYLAEAFVRDTRLLLEAPLLCQLFLGHHLFPERGQGMIVHQSLGPSAAAAIFHELDWLAGSAGQQTQASPLLMRASLLKCLALIEADFAHQGMKLQSPLEDPLVRFVMMKSDAAMNEGMPAQIDAWAEEYAWTPDHLSRSFKAITGESPSVYHQRRRLQRAADELIHGALSLTEIAINLGFADSAHFTRGFRKQFAMTPSAYRRRFR